MKNLNDCRTTVLLAALVSGVFLCAPFEDCAAFDSLDSLWGENPAVSQPDKRQLLTRDELQRMRQSAHDVPLRALNEHEQALLRAAAAGSLDEVKKILATDINISVRDPGGDNAVALAVRGSHFEVVRELLARGAWPSGKAADGFTPLATAAMRGHTPIVRALLRADARPDEITDNRNNALSLAVLFDRAAVVRELLKYGADTTVPNGTAPLHAGQPPLIVAAALGHTEIVQVLLDHGADPDLMDRERHTALLWALLRGNREIAEILLAKGSDAMLLPTPLCTFSFEPGLSVCR